MRKTLSENWAAKYLHWNKDKKKMTEYKNMKKIHEITNHKSAENMIHANANAEIIDEKVRKTAQKVVDSCKVCRRNKRSFSRPSVALPKVVDINQIVTFDLKKWGPKQILWMVCSFTRFLKGVVLNNKEGPTVINALHKDWICNLGYPSTGFWGDNSVIGT